MGAQHLSLATWINQLGTTKVARLVGVKPATVRHWRSGYCLPNDHQKRMIKRASKGAVGYDQIIDGGGR